MKVQLIGSYGGDETHALSAWTSTDRALVPEKYQRIDKLLWFLAKEGHHTPFEKSFIHFLVDVDTASHIHILKHRIGVSVNGESARYKEIEPRHHVPTDWPKLWQDRLKIHAQESETLYREAVRDLQETLGRKRAKESARFFLPYANELTLDVSFNFRSFMHFQGLRNADDAQREIQHVAAFMLELVRETGDFDLSLKGFEY